MSVIITADALSELDVARLTRAFARTRDFGIPPQITKSPTIDVDGVKLRWTSPRITADRAAAILIEYTAHAEHVTDDMLARHTPIGG